MTDFGVTATGFNRKTLRDILTEIETDELAGIAADLDVSTEQIMGQINGVHARQLSICWEQLEILYNSNDPDVAEGRLLEMLGKLTGTFRRGNTPSTVVLQCDLDMGTTLVSGTAYAAVEGKADIRWTPLEDYTAASGGVQPVTFQSELTGAIEGFSGTITSIATPVVGWNSVVNPDDAVLGLETDLDPAFRTRRESELATIGSATVRAITANVNQAFSDKLQSLVVFENDGDATDSNGVPPHAIEVLIFDGETMLVDDDELSQVIFDSKAGGIQTSGNTTGHATALVNGIETLKDVKFSRATTLDMFLKIYITKKLGAQYAGDTAVKEVVATLANAHFGPGDDIVAEQLKVFAFSNAGVLDVTDIKLGTINPPVSSTNFPVTIRQIGRFSASRITVISV